MKPVRYVVEDRGHETPCWTWALYVNPQNGYGYMTARGVKVSAHRWYFEQHIGAIPAGFVIDHLCRNHDCVNPAHMEPVTQRENLARGETFVAANLAKTHCARGHAYDAANTYVGRRGKRECRSCNREKARVRRANERNGHGTNLSAHQ